MGHISMQLVTVSAVSPGRAAGVTLGAIGASIGCGIVLSFVLSLIPYRISLFEDTDLTYFWLYIPALAVLGGFWYGILRLSVTTAPRVWLEAWGLGIITLFLPFLGAKILIPHLPLFNGYYYYSGPFTVRYLLTLSVEIIAFLAFTVWIGISIASGFARWFMFRPLPAKIPTIQAIFQSFGILFVSFVFILLPYLFLGLNTIEYFLLPILVLIYIIAVPFIARGMVLRQLRAVRPDLFVAPIPGSGNPGVGGMPIPGAAAMPMTGAVQGVAGRQDGVALATALVFGGAVLSAFLIPDFYFAAYAYSYTGVLGNVTDLQQSLVGPGLGFQGATVLAAIVAIVLAARTRTASDLPALRIGTMTTALISAILGIILLVVYYNVANASANDNNIALSPGPGLFITGALLLTGAVLAGIRLSEPRA
jgi:hypothetical protein